MSWNVHGCLGTDGRRDPDRIAAVLDELCADVIGLQEVDGRHPPVEGLPQLPYLAQRLGMHAIAGPNLRDEQGDYGNALLTRLDIQARRRIDLSFPGREPRGAIDARLELPPGLTAGPLRVVVTHLGLDRRERSAQLAVLEDELAAGDPAESSLLLGDFNEWLPPKLGRHALIARHPFRTGHRTFPSRFPVFALDRILARPEPASVRTRVLDAPAARRASDHLALIVDIAW